MANTYALNTSNWYRTQTDYDVTFGRSYNGGTVFIRPFAREKLSGDDTNYVHFFDVDNKGVNVNDAFYIAVRGGKFKGFKTKGLGYFHPIVSDNHTLVWEYWNGSSWQALPNLVDNSNGLTLDDQEITWDLPTDWTGYNYIDENNHNYPAFWIRARLDSFTNLTDGGKSYWQYCYTLPHTIIVSGSDAYTGEDVYNADQTNGWGMTEKKGNTIVFKTGWINLVSNAVSFTSSNDKRATNYQFGTLDEPAFYSLQIFRGSYPVYANYTTSQTSFVTRKKMNLTFYTAWMPVGYGNADYLAFGAYTRTNKAIYNNVDLMMISNYSETTNDIYNPYFAVYRFIPISWADFRQCSFKTTRNTGGLVTEYYTSYWHCNLSEIQYILTKNYQASYDDCLIVNAFNIDPQAEVIFMNSTFANYGSSTTTFYSRYTPYHYINSHYLELRDCYWTNGNDYVKSNSFNNYSSENLYLITVWGHSFNIKVVDEQGNPVEGATVTVKDKFGYPQLRKRVEGVWYAYIPEKYYPILIADDNDTQLPMTISAQNKFSEGDYIQIMGETMKVTGFTPYDSLRVYVDVERRALGTSFHQNNSIYYSTSGTDDENTSWGVYKVEDSVTTDSNGETGEYVVTERRQHRQGDINTYEEIVYNPFTIEITAKGYRKYVWTGNITQKVNWEVTLSKSKVLNLANPVQIYE